MQKKTLIIAMLIALAIVSILAYLLYSHIQFTRKLASISMQAQEVKNYIDQYPKAQYRITEDKLTKNATTYECWIVTWHNPESDFFMHTVLVWIDKETLEILEVQEAW
jgi:predicted small secreted protein